MKNTYKFESFKDITADQISEIRDLEKLCNKNDNTHYQLFLENTLNADRTIDFIYLCRFNGDLVALVLLFFPNIKDIELYGFTHPDHRREGIFSKLISSAEKSLNKYDSCSFLYTCDQDSVDGKAFLNNINGNLEEIEYMMELDNSSYEIYKKTRENYRYKISMEHGELNRLEEISSVAAFIYGEDDPKSSDFVKQTILSDNKDQLIGTVNGKIVGICTVGTEDDFVMISGMGIDSEFRGKGYGRELLDQAVSYALEKYNCSFRLEVSSVNDRAYKLYKSIGFRQNESYGYYRVK